jgi:hypothetical protein
VSLKLVLIILFGLTAFLNIPERMEAQSLMRPTSSSCNSYLNQLVSGPVSFEDWVSGSRGPWGQEIISQLQKKYPQHFVLSLAPHRVEQFKQILGEVIRRHPQGEAQSQFLGPWKVEQITSSFSPRQDPIRREEFHWALGDSLEAEIFFQVLETLSSLPDYLDERNESSNRDPITIREVSYSLNTARSYGVVFPLPERPAMFPDQILKLSKLILSTDWFPDSKAKLVIANHGQSIILDVSDDPSQASTILDRVYDLDISQNLRRQILVGDLSKIHPGLVENLLRPDNYGRGQRTPNIHLKGIFINWMPDSSEAKKSEIIRLLTPLGFRLRPGLQNDETAMVPPERFPDGYNQGRALLEVLSLSSAVDWVR